MEKSSFSDTFAQVQNFLTFELPELIINGFMATSTFVGEYLWWLFLLFAMVFGFLYVKSLTHLQQEQKKRDETNHFLKEIAICDNLSELENKLFNNLPRFEAQYGAIFRKHGEVYILYTSSLAKIAGKSPISIPLRIRKDELSKLQQSGNFKISSFLSQDEEFLMLLYAHDFLDKSIYEGEIALILAYYDKFFQSYAEQTETSATKVNENASHILHEIAFEQNGYLKIISAMALRIVEGLGAKIIDNEDRIIVELGDLSEGVEKIFYIRNTSFRFILKTKEALSGDEMKQIGSFLDMAGFFFAMQDNKSFIARNFMRLLIKANELLENKSPYYRYHSEKVKIVAVQIAKTLFLGKYEIHNLELAAQVHDIGMIGDLESILEDNEQLSNHDLDPIKNHPILGSILVEPVSALYPIAPIIIAHHERYDGHGYPFGVMAADTPVEARILALAEVYIGLISDRPYRKGMSFEEAAEEIRKGSSKAFDPTVVTAFTEAQEEIEKLLERFDLKHQVDESENA